MGLGSVGGDIGSIMSYDLALNRLDHDLVFSKSDAVKYSIFSIEGADRVAQQIKINLLAFLGEWFLDITFGVPYLEEILIKNPRLSAVESIIRGHINSVPDVIRVDAFAMDWDRKMRTLRITYDAETELGPISDSFQLEVNRNINV